MIHPSKLKFLLSIDRKLSLKILITLAALYAVLLCFEFPIVDRPKEVNIPAVRIVPLNSEEDRSGKFAPLRPCKLPMISGIAFSHSLSVTQGNFSELYRSAREAWQVGRNLFEELRSSSVSPPIEKENRTEENCPLSVVLNGEEFKSRGRVMFLPCGLTLGSYITVAAKPHYAHADKKPKNLAWKMWEEATMVSQFIVELQGLKTVDGEEPPRILHFNPRFRGDWSGRAVIEQNTCYRMQWGIAQRCEGWKSRDDEETVDGQLKCEKWIRDVDHFEKSKKTWGLRSMGGEVSIEWPYPFVEDELFVLIITAGLEGYHVNVNGRHVTSFPHRTGFVLEDATGLSINGDLEVQSVFAASLPSSHPNFTPHRSLEMLPKWQVPSPSNGPVELFIGVLSAGNHFAERMAVRKSWMEAVRKSPSLVARFFVALNGRKEVNVELKKEAEYFGDIVIVPYMDSYDLVVLKTVAICEYGIHMFKAKYLMKCDDDTFVRVDSVMNEIQKVPTNKSLYVGNINYYHKPLRQGKWAVTYEESKDKELESWKTDIESKLGMLSSMQAEIMKLKAKSHNDYGIAPEHWLNVKSNIVEGVILYIAKLGWLKHGLLNDPADLSKQSEVSRLLSTPAMMVPPFRNVEGGFQPFQFFPSQGHPIEGTSVVTTQRQGEKDGGQSSGEKSFKF